MELAEYVDGCACLGRGIHEKKDCRCGADIFKPGVAGDVYGGDCFLMRSHSKYISEHGRMRAQALSLAHSHLEEKYRQEMVYVEHYYQFSEMYYTVYFHPLHNPDLVFDVMVTEREDENLEPEERVSVRGDNYYTRFFERELCKKYTPDIESIWGSGTDCGVSLIKSVPEDEKRGLGETGLTEETHVFLDDSYDLFIKPTYMLQEKDISEVAQMILDTLIAMKQYPCQPKNLFIYKYGKDGSAKSKSAPFSLVIDSGDFDKYTDMSQIEELIKEKQKK